MLGVLLGFVSSMLWGASDFAGGVSSRRSSALHATLWSFVAATAVSAMAVGLFWQPLSSVAVIAGVLAGVFGLAGFLTLYASLAAATMGVVTVIVGAVEAIVPVIVGVGWYHERLSVASWIGAAVAMAGAALLGWAEGGGGRAPWGPLILATASGLFFGLSVVALDAAPVDSGLVTPALEVAVGLVLLLAIVWLVRRVGSFGRAAQAIGITAGDATPGRLAVRIALIGGVFLALANIALLLALREGQLAVVGVVLCLYPLTTAVLARVFLGERLTPKHLVGIAVALAGCVLLALG